MQPFSFLRLREPNSSKRGDLTFLYCRKAFLYIAKQESYMPHAWLHLQSSLLRKRRFFQSLRPAVSEKIGKILEISWTNHARLSYVKLSYVKLAYLTYLAILPFSFA